MRNTFIVPTEPPIMAVDYRYQQFLPNRRGLLRLGVQSPFFMRPPPLAWPPPHCCGGVWWADIMVARLSWIPRAAVGGLWVNREQEARCRSH